MNQALDITIKNLIRENYDLRCCENCCHIDDSYACYRDRHNAKEGFCCKEWEYDGRTIKERMKI